MNILHSSGSKPDRIKFISVTTVRSWCLINGFDRLAFRAFYHEAHLTCISRLLQSIYVERICGTALVEMDQAGIWSFRMGEETVLEVELDSLLPHSYVSVVSFPRIHHADTSVTARSAGIFLRAITRILLDSLGQEGLAVLSADYQNSFGNMILNLALASQLDNNSAAIEPTYCGHSHYPFPALRIGVSVEDVVTESHLSRQAISLPLLATTGCRFHSINYENLRQCEAAWVGFQSYTGTGAVIPVHPWQMRHSPVVRELLRRQTVALLPQSLPAVPLASQRTCRVLTTQFDLKLPINVTITSEHRLLYRLNSYNAPFVSSLVEEIHRMSRLDNIGFQYDVASLCWDDVGTSMHLGAIIRAPLVQAEGESIVPALSLWTNQELAHSMLELGNRSQVLDLFRRYCWAVMRGPLLLCAEWGVALEPHLQNTCIVIKQGIPIRIIMRDLDSSILDHDRIFPVCQEHGIPLARDTWASMPAPAIGQSRLIHALFHGHLREVMHFLLKHTEVDLATLNHCLDVAWEELASEVTTSEGRNNLETMRKLVGGVKKNLLMRLERSVSMSFQNLTDSTPRQMVG